MSLALLLFAGPAAATSQYQISWDVTFSTDPNVIALGTYSPAGAIALGSGGVLSSFQWTTFASISSANANHSVNLLGVQTGPGGQVTGVNLSASNNFGDNLSLSTNQQVSNLFSFTAGGVGAMGRYRLSPAIPEPAAAIVFGIGLLLVRAGARGRASAT